MGSALEWRRKSQGCYLLFTEPYRITAAAVSTNTGARFTDLLVFQRPRLTWIVDNSNSVEKTIANSAKLESVFNPLPFFLENDLSDLENFYIFGILIRHSFRFRIFFKSEEV
jgi:hypothetical protein